MTTNVIEAAGYTTPARQEVRPITAISLDGRIDWANALPLAGCHEIRRGPHGRSFELAGGNRLFLFDFGAAVFEGVAKIPDSLRLLVEESVSRKTIEETEETSQIVVDPELDSAMPKVGWDRVTIHEDRPELIGAVALLLGQSSALERYEVSADRLLDQALELTREIAIHSRLPLGTRHLIQRVARLTQDRLELARWFYLVDRPEETWQDARVAHLYDALFGHLELRQRHEAMLHKLEASENAAQTTLEMWHGRRSNALEWAIVVLIVVEIVLAFWDVL